MVNHHISGRNTLPWPFHYYSHFPWPLSNFLTFLVFQIFKASGHNATCPWLRHWRMILKFTVWHIATAISVVHYSIVTCFNVIYMCTAVTEKQTFGPGPYGYDSSITTRGRIHTPACAITGRHSDKGLSAMLRSTLMLYATLLSNTVKYDRTV